VEGIVVLSLEEIMKKQVGVVEDRAVVDLVRELDLEGK
jgi:hypothetical protein